MKTESNYIADTAHTCTLLPPVGISCFCKERRREEGKMRVFLSCTYALKLIGGVG